VRPVPIALIALAAITGGARGAPAAPDVVVKDGVEVSMLPALAPTTGPDGGLAVTLDVEARSDDAAGRLGFRSLRVVTLVDCRAGANKLLEAESFEASDLAGARHVRPVSGEWVRPAADSYMAAVAARVCAAGAGDEHAAAPIRVTLAPPAAPAAAPATVSPAPPAATPPTPTTVAMNPARIALSAPPTTAGPAATAGPRLEAQVAASRTAREARQALAALGALLAPPLAGDVEAAQVQGARVFRASVTGFASLAQARAFCAQAARLTRNCWVRQAEAAPPPSGRPRPNA
jgi:hypothetical protein